MKAFMEIKMARPQTHGMYQTRLYRIWHGMKNRCLNKKIKDYSRYGGRGITVCNDWLTFMPFMFWAQESGYTDDLTIDRIDPNGNYCPKNCKWVTVLENSRNRRKRSEWKRRSNTKITAEQVQAIIADYQSGMTLKALGIKHGISPAYAGEVGRGQKRTLDR
jgi:hypothetical protein